MGSILSELDPVQANTCLYEFLGRNLQMFNVLNIQNLFSQSAFLLLEVPMLLYQLDPLSYFVIFHLHRLIIP
jgi:hypothetical protein